MTGLFWTDWLGPVFNNCGRDLHTLAGVLTSYFILCRHSDQTQLLLLLRHGLQRWGNSWPSHMETSPVWESWKKNSGRRPNWPRPTTKIKWRKSQHLEMWGRHAGFKHHQTCNGRLLRPHLIRGTASSPRLTAAANQSTGTCKENNFSCNFKSVCSCIRQARIAGDSVGKWKQDVRTLLRKVNRRCQKSRF